MLKHFKPHIAIAAVAAGLLMPATALAGIGSFTTRGAWSFVSASKLHPPKLTTLSGPAKKGLARGYFLASNFPIVGGKSKMVGNGGPVILDSHLQPVWVLPVSTNLVAATLRKQSYKGKPVLTYWQGAINGQGITTSGEDIVVDQTYRTVATLKGADGWVISEHDMVISGHDAWVTAYKNVANAPGAPAGVTVFDAAVQKYDLTTGKLLYTWDALQNIPLAASFQPPGRAGSRSSLWDAYHVNSIQLVSGNRFLVSMRNTWAAYLVSDVTSKIEWTLGGRNSTFRMGRGAQFQWQHDVELHKSQVSVYDDHCCGLNPATNKFNKPTGPSRALVLNLSTTKHTATVARSITRGSNFVSYFLGNTQLLPNGNFLVSWGSTPYFSEYSKTGKLLFDASWPYGGRFVSNTSYRTYLANWSATPFFPPSGAVRTSKGKTTVYASWDGATGVSAWRVLAGSSATHLATVVRRASRTGFETAIKLPKGYGFYEVQALNRRGRVIGSSTPFGTRKSGGPPGGQFY